MIIKQKSEGDNTLNKAGRKCKKYGEQADRQKSKLFMTGKLLISKKYHPGNNSTPGYGSYSELTNILFFC
jgi:hypothetical protein